MTPKCNPFQAKNRHKAPRLTRYLERCIAEKLEMCPRTMTNRYVELDATSPKPNSNEARNRLLPHYCPRSFTTSKRQVSAGLRAAWKCWALWCKHKYARQETLVSMTSGQNATKLETRKQKNPCLSNRPSSWNRLLYAQMSSQKKMSIDMYMSTGCRSVSS